MVAMSNNPNTSRIVWMDMVRGSMILLVIIHHWISRVNEYDSLSSMGIYQAIYNIKIFFAPFRMELLFFLSGLIVRKSIKKDKNEFINGKIKNVLYPYIIWSCIYLVAMTYKHMFSGETRQVIEYVFRITTGTCDLTWFLYFLFVYFMISRVILNKEVNPFIVLFICFACIMIIPDLGFYKSLEVDFIKESDLFYYFIFFYLGCILGIKGVDIPGLSKRKPILLLSIASLIVVEMINFQANTFKTSIVYLPFVLMAIPLLVVTGGLISKVSAVRKILGHLSINSIVYYLSHYILIMIYFKAFSISKINEQIYCPLVLILTLLSGYFIVRAKRKFNLINLLFTPKLLTLKPSVT